MSEALTISLSACPFCNGEAVWRSTKGSQAQNFDDQYRATCGVGYCAETPYMGTRQEAADWWNRRTPVEWESAAEQIAKHVETPLGAVLRKASDTFYADVLSDVQCYLRDNASFNLGAELDREKRDTAAAHGHLERIAQTLGLARRGWPTGRAGDEACDAIIARVQSLLAAEKGVGDQERTSIIGGLRERAEWLESECRKGGDASHLRPRATEALAIAQMIERGRFSAPVAAADPA